MVYVIRKAILTLACVLLWAALAKLVTIGTKVAWATRVERSVNVLLVAIRSQ